MSTAQIHGKGTSTIIISSLFPFQFVRLAFSLISVFGKCYFPGELQGVWATQAAPEVLNAPVRYTMVTIDANKISTWGQCLSKIDDNLILADR